MVAVLEIENQAHIFLMIHKDELQVINIKLCIHEYIHGPMTMQLSLLPPCIAMRNCT